MGLAIFGKVADGYNKVNDSIAAGRVGTTTQEEADNFLGNWIREKLPEAITGLAATIVDDGSGAIAKSALDAGTKDSNIFGTLFR